MWGDSPEAVSKLTVFVRFVLLTINSLFKSKNLLATETNTENTEENFSVFSVALFRGCFALFLVAALPRQEIRGKKASKNSHEFHEFLQMKLRRLQ